MAMGVFRSGVCVFVATLFLVVAGPSIADDETDMLHFAAEQGRADAQYSLGVRYENGKGVPQDYAEAFRWYRLAAEQGNAPAQFKLGVMYGNGQGVLQDYVAAHMWVNLAAAQGNANASKNRGIVASKMTSAQIAEAQRLAREWVPRSN
jgi:hypothetical protein